MLTTFLLSLLSEALEVLPEDEALSVVDEVESVADVVPVLDVVLALLEEEVASSAELCALDIIPCGGGGGGGI
ncbi:hypothetical protein [Pleomorphomonas sp. PLEO]|uniref:hypothetical protein n=1 Tax=Pleomorphomonas sp. PLEO TaxID=3239306 RepID=UPI00351E5D48